FGASAAAFGTESTSQASPFLSTPPPTNLDFKASAMKASSDISSTHATKHPTFTFSTPGAETPSFVFNAPSSTERPPIFNFGGNKLASPNMSFENAVNAFGSSTEMTGLELGGADR